MNAERFIYWKAEVKESAWNLIPDTEEERRKAIDLGAMFFTWTSLSKPYENSGSPEPHRWGDLPLDFDCPDDIGIALADLRSLCLSHLPRFYDIDPHEINFFLSGGKGFHAVIPARLLGTEGGDPQLPLIYKRVVAQWKADLNLQSLDLSLYCMRKGRMLRIPNVKRSNGNYKVPLLVEEIMTAGPQELIGLGNRPRTLETF